jgi:hypothetical protein
VSDIWFSADVSPIEKVLLLRLDAQDRRLREEHQIAFEMAEHLKWMTERCRGLERRLLEAERGRNH